MDSVPERDEKARKGTEEEDKWDAIFRQRELEGKNGTDDDDGGGG